MMKSGSNQTTPGRDNVGPGGDNSGQEAIIQVPEVKIKVLGCNNAGPWK